ncbi:ABC transporter permease [Alkaliphilus oremlandii]|uniref:ABC-2 type transporter n=1 Tax=Alkaliphilus oremlandii (strain OhILAs) TaxID=350688 RepID=A8MJY3_ALKOO|nr:ABC transporter permease [Alkaliphilus oremlandii]ABW20115.1 ABC-2 type transporter [Alkaliphilus oremlandii OhILAs]
MLLNLIGKDLKRALRDRKAMMITLIMPTVLITILGFSVGRFLDNDREWMDHSTVGIVNLDNSQEGIEKLIDTITELWGDTPLSVEDINKIKKDMGNFNIEKILLEDIFGSQHLSKVLSYRLLEEKEALGLLGNKELSAVIIIPKDFTYYTVMSLTSPFTYKQEIQVIKNKDDGFTGRIVEEIMTGFTNILSSGIVAKSSLFEVGAEMGVGDQIYGEIGVLLEKTLAQTSNVEIKIENRATMNTIKGMQYYSVGQAMMFVLYIAGYGAKYAFDEKRFYTYERLRISNVTKSDILLSRGIITFLIAFMQIYILILYSSLLFRITWGEPLAVLILTTVMALAVSGISIFLTAMNYTVGNMKISNLFDNIIIMIFAALGGSFIPVKGIPFLQKIGAFTPNGAAINGYIKLMQGYGLGDIGDTLTLLISIFIIFSVLGMVLLRRGEAAL